jgi:hypothetical protein
MLHKQPHQHIASWFSPCSQENRLTWKQPPPRKQKQDDSNLTPESLEQVADGLKSAAEQNEQAKRKKQTRRSNENVQTMTDERRQRILRHVPGALLEQYTLGAAYLTDTLVSMLGEQELRSLIKQHPEFASLDLKETADIDALLQHALENETKHTSSLLSSLDVRTAMLLTQTLESKLRQYDELKEAAINHLQGNESLAGKIDSKEQSLELERRSIDDWLWRENTQKICDELGIPPVPENQRELLTGRIRNYLDTKRRLSKWNMPEMERNQRLREMLMNGSDAAGLQLELYTQLKKSLPALVGVLQARMADEAELTEQWLTEEKAQYGDDLRDITPANHDAKNAAFLGKHGVSAVAASREIEEIESAVALARDGKVIREDDPGTVINASALCDRLQQTRQYPDGKRKDVLDPLKPDQSAAEGWSNTMQRELNTVLDEQYADATERERIARGFGVPDFFATLEEMRTDLATGIDATEYSMSRRSALTHMVRSLRSKRIAHAVSAFHEEKETAPVVDNVDRTVADIIQQTRGRLDAAVGSLAGMPILNSGISEVLGVTNRIAARGETLANILREVEGQRKTETHLHFVQVEVRKMETAAQMLQGVESMQGRLLTEEAFLQRTGTRNAAVYDLATGDILVNRDRCVRENLSIPDLVKHEREHAAQDILVRRAGVFPFLHRAAFEVLQENRREFGSLLAEQSEAWGIAHQRDRIRQAATSDEEALALEQELLTEELLNRYVDWKRNPALAVSAQERELFAMVESTDLINKLKGVADRAPETSMRADIRGMQMFHAGAVAQMMPTDLSALGGEHAVDTPAHEESGPSNLQSDLKDCQTMISKLQNFMTAQPQYKANLPEMLPKFQDAHDTLKTVFLTQKKPNGEPYPHPEIRQEFQNMVKALKNDLDKWQKYSRNIDNELHDLTEVGPADETMWDRFFGNVAFMSPLDIYLMVQDSIEDVKRMWARRSKQSRSKVAQGLFSVIPENDLPGLRYLGRLEKENEKREQQAEDEEVEVWKEGLKNKDPEQLIHILSQITTNQDQAKAIFFLLADKGRIDWGSTVVWEVLNHLSQYKMPIEQCKRDIVLRNNWLNKLVDDIWDDKDLFWEWKTHNDSSYNSKRDHFNEYVDTLSQNSGAMRAELERILRLHVKDPHNPPADVNPHVYEKIIEFAMVKGKMSMEDKFYYLIRGIAEGLLPLERLNIINNQVLGTFPFIDYFAGQYNTMSEIVGLSSRITESGNAYRPGLKTTLFLETELARDESTRQRVMKVITRSGEQIDHEDVPMLMAFLDYGGLNEMNKPFSGQRQRMTKEGVKNGYVGFNTLFKTYARVADLDREGTARFTSKDASQLGRSLMTYIHYDNMVSEASKDKDTRQTLTREQIEQETMPSGGGRTASAFRNPMNQLALQMFQAYGITRVQAGTKKEKDASGNERDVPAYVSIDDYLGASRGWKFLSDEQKQKIFSATSLFQDLLLQKISSDPNTFTEVLRQNGNKLLQERQSDSDEINVEHVREAMVAQQAGASHGGGHGSGGHH